MKLMSSTHFNQLNELVEMEVNNVTTTPTTSAASNRFDQTELEKT